MAKRPTIATVAAHAGVAVSTVSRYLNGHYVSQDVRARLSTVIADLGYSRSWTARNLSLGRRGSIGVVVDASDDPWFVQLLTGIEEELAPRDTSLMLASLELRGRYDPAVVFEWIRSHRVDGLIVAKGRRRERALFRAAADGKLPVIAVAPDESVPQVQLLRCNNAAGGHAVAEHLVALGHRDVGFVCGPDHSIDSKHRLRGFQDGMVAAGLAVPESRVFRNENWDIDAGTVFGQAFLSAPREVTALAFANDAMALGFMRVAHARGVRVPEELSVAGFDGLPYGALAFPALTTVAQPTREMGRVACQRLFDTLEAPGRIERIEFPVELIVRESTGPADPAHKPTRHLRVV